MTITGLHFLISASKPFSKRRFMNKMRFRRNSNHTVKGRIILNKTLRKSRSGTKELREMPSI
jgi:hypothetical protein